MEVTDIIKPENQVFSKTCLMTDTNLSYCPGCGHGTAQNLAMEVIDEMGIVEDRVPSLLSKSTAPATWF